MTTPDRNKPVAADQGGMLAERRAKLAQLRVERGAYPNDFQRTHTTLGIAQKYSDMPGDELDRTQIAVAVAGRIMAKSSAGDVSLGVLQDGFGSIQIALSDEASGKSSHAAYAQWDTGDIVGLTGMLHKRASGELAVRVHEIRLLVKALWPPAKDAGAGGAAPLPRYAELTVNPQARKALAVRSRAVQGIRAFLGGTDYMEVETPMLQPVPGAEPAQSFATHHNALGVNLYLRGSAIPYLARLAVGGMEKVYEINRSFQQVAAAADASPEVTVMEIYCAYASHLYMMALLELLIARAAKFSLGTTSLTCAGREVALGKPFPRVSPAQAIRQHGAADWSDAQLRDRDFLSRRLNDLGVRYADDAGWGALQLMLFRALAVPHLIEPVFVSDLPFEQPSLARRSGLDPEIAERFELYIGGRAIATGASVGNDPEALGTQLRDPELMRALEYGLPPAACATLFIDRLVMLLTGSTSIQEAILFPHARG